MEFKKFENQYVLRLEKGEEIITSLKQFCAAEKITAGTVQGIGAAGLMTVGFFNPGTKAYKEKTFDRFLEITSLTGNITTKEGQPYLHLHINAAGDDYQTVGGHLVAAVISLTSEITVCSVNGKIERTMSDEIGINLLDFNK